MARRVAGRREDAVGLRSPLVRIREQREVGLLLLRVDLGGVGLGGGLSFPLGSSRGRDIVTTELTVTIKRRADQSPVWEGSSRTYADARAADATASSQAAKLAGALFTGFPGESGRTIEVK